VPPREFCKLETSRASARRRPTQKDRATPRHPQGTVVGDTHVAHAVVSWFGRVNGSDEADVFGRYEAPGLPAGDYLFTASFPGCEPGSASVSVVAGDTVVQDLHLQC
jgi:hypothetical protein